MNCAVGGETQLGLQQLVSIVINEIRCYEELTGSPAASSSSRIIIIIIIITMGACPMSTVFIDEGFPFLYCRHASCPAAILRRAPTSFLRTAACGGAAAAGLLTARPHLCLSSDQLASSTTLPLTLLLLQSCCCWWCCWCFHDAIHLSSSSSQIGNQ